MLFKNLLLLTTFSMILFANTANAKRYVVPEHSAVVQEINNPLGTTLQADSIKILTWNMYKGDKSSWSRDFKKIIKDQDILLLQEVYLDYQMSSAFYQDEIFSYKMATSFIDTKKRNAPSGVATASHARPTNFFYKRSKYREPFIKTPKMLMFATYDLEGHDKDLLTVNIHAINFVSARKLRHMLRQIEVVVREHDGPVVIGGDFNTWSKKKTRYLKAMARRLAIYEVPFGKGRMKVFGNVIDFVFTRGLEVKSHKVYKEIRGSDHAALGIEVSVAALN